MAKRKKKKKGYKDGMMKKVSKQGKTYGGHETLLKSGAATTTDSKPIDKDLYNKADSMLNHLTKNVGIPRQKVRMK